MVKQFKIEGKFTAKFVCEESELDKLIEDFKIDMKEYAEIQDVDLKLDDNSEEEI